MLTSSVSWHPAGCTCLILIKYGKIHCKTLWVKLLFALGVEKSQTRLYILIFVVFLQPWSELHSCERFIFVLCICSSASFRESQRFSARTKESLQCLPTGRGGYGPLLHGPPAVQQYCTDLSLDLCERGQVEKPDVLLLFDMGLSKPWSGPAENELLTVWNNVK